MHFTEREHTSFFVGGITEESTLVPACQTMSTPTFRPSKAPLGIKPPKLPLLQSILLYGIIVIIIMTERKPNAVTKLVLVNHTSSSPSSRGRLGPGISPQGIDDLKDGGDVLDKGVVSSGTEALLHPVWMPPHPLVLETSSEVAIS